MRHAIKAIQFYFSFASMGFSSLSVVKYIVGKTVSQLNTDWTQLLTPGRYIIAIICDGLPANRPDLSSVSVGQWKTAAGELLGVRLTWLT
jgi:hypothetical protein